MTKTKAMLKLMKCMIRLLPETKECEQFAAVLPTVQLTAANLKLNEDFLVAEEVILLYTLYILHVMFHHEHKLIGADVI